MSINRMFIAVVAASVVGQGLLVSEANAQPLTSVRVAAGLARPVFVVHAPGDLDRIFIGEQHTGQIKIHNLAAGTINAAPFLTVTGLNVGNEQGLLGMAFHPDYATNGLFYVDFTSNTGGNRTHIQEFQVSAGDPNIASPTPVRELLSISQPQTNHNGGWIAFGPDDMLYIGMGDGGGAGDTGAGHDAATGNGQDITINLLGKMLRIDVNGDDFPGDPNRNYVIPPNNPFVGITGDDEIWAYGLRNPWRSTFDSATGDLWIGDVGQNAWEELDFQTANLPGSMPGDAGYQGGLNYGWRCREGAHNFNFAAFCNALTFVEPFQEYNHSLGCSITGGEVYRGCAASNLRGTYFYSDFCSSTLWSLRYDGVTVTEFMDRTVELIPDIGSIGSVSSFGSDAFGEIYICDLGGEVFRIETAFPLFAVADVDGSRMVDIDDATTLANVLLENGVFDVCTLQRADVNGDGDRDGLDIEAWLNAI